MTIVVYPLTWVDDKENPGKVIGYRSNLKVATVTFMTDRKVRITVVNPTTMKKKLRAKKSIYERSIRMDITGGIVEAQRRAETLYAFACLR